MKDYGKPKEIPPVEVKCVQMNLRIWFVSLGW